MKAKTRLLEGLLNAFATKGRGSAWLVAASALSVAALGAAIGNVLCSLSQCLLYPIHWTVNPDPRASFHSTVEQLILPGLFFLCVLGALSVNARRNAHTPDLVFEPPQPHEGLLLMLSRYDRRGASPYETLAAARSALEAGPLEAVRDGLLGSTFGPLIAAVEHHRPALKRCWIIATGGPSGTAQYADDAAAILQRVAPGIEITSEHLQDASDIPALAHLIGGIYREAAHHASVRGRLIADFTSGTAAMSAAMVIATLNEDRDVEYLRQDVKLFDDNRALSAGEILHAKALMSVSTTPALVRELLN